MGENEREVRRMRMRMRGEANKGSKENKRGR